jgi:hypothetical protein
VAARAIKFGSILGSILKGAKAPSAEISAEIAKLEQDRSVATESLRNLIAKADAAILDGDDGALDRIERERTALERTIQKARLAFPLLKEKLETALNEERLELINHRRRVRREAFETLAAALTAAVVANEASIAGDEAAARELGSNDAALLVGIANYPYVNRDLVQHWILTVRGELESAARTAPRSPTPTKLVPPRFVDMNKIIPHFSPGFQHGTALFHDQFAPQAARPAIDKSARAAPSRAAPAAPAPRVPRCDVAGDGLVLVKVMKPGYHDAACRPCSFGDVIAVTPEIAHAAVSRAAVEFVDAEGDEA